MFGPIWIGPLHSRTFLQEFLSDLGHPPKNVDNGISSCLNGENHSSSTQLDISMLVLCSFSVEISVVSPVSSNVIGFRVLQLVITYQAMAKGRDLVGFFDEVRSIKEAPKF